VVFGAFYSPDTLGLYRRMARRAREAGVRCVDLSVYSHRRLWRLACSRNGKSGLFKIPLTYEELRDIGIDGIKRMAVRPRPEETLARHTACQEATEWYRRALAAYSRLKARSRQTRVIKKFRRGWRMPPCIKAIQAATLPDGTRHQTYLSLARFYNYIGMHPEELRERLEDLDVRHPIRDPDYIERAVVWGCDHPGFPGCDDDSLRRHCRPEECFYARLKNTRTKDA
jgi:hypothetical protein